MARRTLLSLLLAFSSAGSTFALNNRSAVSRNGLDTNPCTVASPCRSFASAISATNDGGDVVALDTAGYGPFQFDRSLTVSGAPGVEASITATSGAAIVVNTQDVVAVIRNLTLIGAGGIEGIAINVGKDVFIFNCLVLGFLDYGILASSALFGVNVDIERTRVLDTVGGILSRGIFMGGSSNSVHGVIHDCLISGTGSTNVEIQDHADVTITNSTISNSGAGVFVNSIQAVGAPSQLAMDSCNIANNGTGLAVGSNSTGDNPATAMFSKNVFFSNTYAVYRTANGTAISFGNNRLVDNVDDSYPSPFATTTLK